MSDGEENMTRKKERSERKKNEQKKLQERLYNKRKGKV
jgi:hypothetical protein